jgi:hypothetical protein
MSETVPQQLTSPSSISFLRRLKTHESQPVLPLRKSTRQASYLMPHLNPAVRRAPRASPVLNGSSAPALSNWSRRSNQIWSAIPKPAVGVSRADSGHPNADNVVLLV